MKICDMHTHSNNSFDALNSVDEMCQSAINKELYAISITDHCEAPMIKEGKLCKFGYFDELIPKSNMETMRAKEKYSSEIKVLCGIELGEPMHDEKCTQKALSYGEYDFILASVHNLRGMEDFYYIDFSAVDIKKILNLYFEELAETANFNNFDSLAHLTNPLRYIKEKTGVILEINVSGLYKGLGTTLPDETQIKRFRELGGKYITLGSDSHSCEYVGKDIDRGIELAKKCGFTHYTIYEKRRPILIEI